MPSLTKQAVDNIHAAVSHLKSGTAFREWPLEVRPKPRPGQAFDWTVLYFNYRPIAAYTTNTLRVRAYHGSVRVVNALLRSMVGPKAPQFSIGEWEGRPAMLLGCTPAVWDDRRSCWIAHFTI